MNIKKWFSAAFLIFMLSVIKINVMADKVVATNVDELVNLVNTATETRTIELDANFPSTIDETIKLIANTDSEIIIDGKNSTVLSPGTNADPLINYTRGAATGGNLVIKNIEFDGKGATKRAFNYSNNSTSGLLTLDNVLVKDFHKPGDGGAMYIAGNTKIINSSFDNNSTKQNGYTGGAISGKAFGYELTVENSSFTNNQTLALGTTVGGEGGAMFFYNPSASAKFTFKNNYFYGNKAVENAWVENETNAKRADGGAIALFNVVSGTSVLFEGNTFEENIAGDNGGAVLIQTNDTFTSGVTFKNNTFYKNVAKSTSTATNSGGAIQIYGNGSPMDGKAAIIDFTSNSFIDNTAVAKGGAIAIAGYITNIPGGRFTNNLFAGNVSQNSSSTNNIANSGASKSSASDNIGYSSPIARDEIFGSIANGLVDNYNKIQAGHITDRKTLQTVPITPEMAADSIVLDGTSFGADQRNIARQSPSDVGAVDAQWIKYDSNGGDFNFSDPLTTQDGKTYYNGKQTSAYYKIGYYGIETTIPAGEDDLGIEREEYTFLGWSRSATATKPDDDLTESSTLEIEKQDLTVYAVWEAVPVPGEPVIVHYQDSDENTISPSVTLNGNIGDPYTTEQKTISGYTFKEMKAGSAATSGVFSEEGQVVTYVYTKDPVPGAPVVAHYQDSDGNKIANDVSFNGNIGDSYSTEQKEIPGYTFKEMKADSAPTSGIFTAEGQVVTYVYTKDPIPGASVIAHYQDGDGNKIAPDETFNGNIGDTYTTEQKVITDYTFKEMKADSAPAVGTFTAEGQEVTYIYTKDVIPAAPVTVNYQDVNGNKIADDITLNGNIGDTYSTEQKVITGYTFKEVKTGSAPTSGSFTAESQTVTYVYTKDSVAGASVIAQYLDNKGNKIAADISLSGNIGDAYTTEQKAIAGYTFKEIKAGSAPTKGTFTATAQKVTYIYTKNPTPGASVVAQYLDSEGNRIAADITLNGNIGDAYATEQKVIAGYSFKEIKAGSASTKGTFTTAEQKVTYIYTKDGSTTPPSTDNSSRTEPNTPEETTDKQLPNTGEQSSFSILMFGLAFLSVAVFFSFKLKSKK